MKKMLLSDFPRMKASDPGTKDCNRSLTRGKEKQRTGVIKGRNSNCGLFGYWTTNIVKAIFSLILIYFLISLDSPQKKFTQAYLVTYTNPLSWNSSTVVEPQLRSTFAYFMRSTVRESLLPFSSKQMNNNQAKVINIDCIHFAND